jgi:spore germination protein GerM
MQMRVAQLVYTATGVAGVDAVRIALDGELVEAIGGEGLVVDHPLTRDEFAQFAP